MTISHGSRRSVRHLLASPQTWVLLVAVLYGLAQIVLLDVGRFLAWDEAVYLSEVSPHAEAVGMGAHRSRGITFLVAPVAVLTDSMVALRVYLAVLSSAALFGAFVVWCRSIEWSAPAAAMLFASSWLAVFYGSAVYPNLYSGLLAVAAIGLALDHTRSPTRSRMVLIVALVALTALVRPLDALLLAVGLGVVALVAGRRSVLTLTGAGLAGLGVGAMPWAIEGWVRFGDPVQRLDMSRDSVGGGLHNNVGEYLRLLDGSGSANTVATVSLGAMIVLGLAGLAVQDRVVRRGALVSLSASILFAAPYLFATEPVASRFLLPALAFLAIAAAVGLVSIVGLLGTRATTIGAITAVVVLALSAWNLPALQAWSERQTGNGLTALYVGEAIGSVASGDCFFLAPSNHPAVSFASGCRGAGLGENGETNSSRLESARDTGAELFAATNSSDPGSLLGDGWRCGPIPELAERGWQLCTPINQ